ncbi:amidohydrolase [Natranaerobius trueperi]|uniref:Peptidase M20 domain-containing protein 2 n=1 Tax=Natranaerobius trueperi TaxID=759412 RepID=A0A226BUK1_9FIRM|nr:amidohydrolase [Natranaerobius trueperi]OWZ82708.1 amidohydrolase [Natranaerobius trueperi]
MPNPVLVSKDQIQNSIAYISKELKKLSQNIHANPELNFQEKKAVQFQKQILENHDFSFENPFGGLETAFKASYSNSKSKDTLKIAFLSEYDALPELGHACGHNLIATSSVGAAIGLSEVLKDFYNEIPFEVSVIGTPGEEGGGGKVHLLEEGGFDDINFALMIHPGNKNMVGRGGLACTQVDVEAFGKKAHSAAPCYGVNALSAIINVFNELDVLKGSIKDSNKINGIITDGGTASNIIPDYAKAAFTVRAKTKEDLTFLLEKFKKITDGASALTDAEIKCEHDLIYEERYPNKSMGELFKTNMEILGEEVNYPDSDEILGSSDIGNVSREIPTIHPYIKITDPPIGGHTRDFEKVSGEEIAESKAIKAAMALAMTGLDIVTSESNQHNIREEFSNTVKSSSS